MNPSFPNIPRPDAPRSLLTRLAQRRVMYILMCAVLLLAAGRLDWPAAWAFLLAYFALAAAGPRWLMRIDPGLVPERSRWGANTSHAWATGHHGIARRLPWLVSSNVDRSSGGAARILPALGVPLLASRASAYLAATERIHNERGHTVVSAGPHAVVRHPMCVA